MCIRDRYISNSIWKSSSAIRTRSNRYCDRVFISKSLFRLDRLRFHCLPDAFLFSLDIFCLEQKDCRLVSDWVLKGQLHSSCQTKSFLFLSKPTFAGAILGSIHYGSTELDLVGQSLLRLGRGVSDSDSVFRTTRWSNAKSHFEFEAAFWSTSVENGWRLSCLLWFGWLFNRLFAGFSCLRFNSRRLLGFLCSFGLGFRFCFCGHLFLQQNTFHCHQVLNGRSRKDLRRFRAKQWLCQYLKTAKTIRCH